MKRPALDSVRAQVAARLESGEGLTWRDVWRMSDDASSSWARQVLVQLHRSGQAHIADWLYGVQRLPIAQYRGGKGQDKPRPQKLSNAEKCARWRAAPPNKVAIARKRARFLRRKSPFMDPIQAALLGYVKHGKGWIKKSKESQCHR